MSASAVSLSTSFRPADTTTPAFTWGRYARAGLLTIGVSVLANAVILYLAQVAVQYDPAFLPLGNSRHQSFSLSSRRLEPRCCTRASSSLFASTPRWSSH